MGDELKWCAKGRFATRYELRCGDTPLTTVSYSRKYGVWSTDRSSGFVNARAAMRWEENRLNLPECPVVETKP